MFESSLTLPENETFVCACESWMRDACVGEEFFKELEGARYCVLHYPGNDKARQFELAQKRKFDAQNFDFRGVWFSEPFGLSGAFCARVNFQGATFLKQAYFRNVEFAEHCSFISAHFASTVDFTDAQFKDGANFLDARFDGLADFRRTIFLECADFQGANLAQANFCRTRFGKGGADFGRTQFNEHANFSDATFSSGSKFSDAHFRMNADFRHAYFQGDLPFIRTTFVGEADFHLATFMGPNPDDVPEGGSRRSFVSFSGARFREGFTFERTNFGQDVRLNLAAVTFDHPERVTLHSTSLRPNWFIDTDPRRFNFINVIWGSLDSRDALQREIEDLEAHDLSRHSPLLEITFRQLAVNAEDNNRYDEAANFRYLAMEVKRLQARRRVDLLGLRWWYWLLSGYGERVQRALVVLLSIWLLFAVTYWTGNATWWQPRAPNRAISGSAEREVQSSEPRRLAFSEALLYSAGVLTLQKPDPQPANKRARFFVLAETLLGPIQAALLALAIRRKFMR